MEEKIRVAVAGCGWIGESHVKAFLSCSNAELVALCDHHTEKMESLIARYDLHVRCYTDLEEMLQKEHLDGVAIATMHRAHAEMAGTALEYGVHVLCEKPMSYTYGEAWEMSELAYQNNRILMIGFQPRFDPNRRKMKELVKGGALGKVYLVETGGGRRLGIPVPYGPGFIRKETAGYGVLGDIGCYSLDMVLDALGYPHVVSVSAYSASSLGRSEKTYLAQGKTPEEAKNLAKAFDVEDIAGALIRLDNNLIIDFRMTWAMHMDTFGDTLFLGTEAGLRVPGSECYSGAIPGDMTRYYIDAENKPAEETIAVDIDPGDLFVLKQKAFCDAVVKAKANPKEEAEKFNPVPIKEMLQLQKLLCGILESANDKREIML